MKIETKKQEFQPVVITLETQEEVDQLWTLATNFGFGRVDCDITIDLFHKLNPMSNYEYDDTKMEFKKYK